MAYQLNALGISVLALLRGRPLCTATRWLQFPQFTVALAAVIDTLGADTAANAVHERIAAPESRIAEITALRDGSITPAGYLVAFDYLLATTRAELSWLHRFAGSTRSGQPRQPTDEVDEVEV